MRGSDKDVTTMLLELSTKSVLMIYNDGHCNRPVVIVGNNAGKNGSVLLQLQLQLQSSFQVSNKY